MYSVSTRTTVVVQDNACSYQLNERNVLCVYNVNIITIYGTELKQKCLENQKNPTIVIFLI